MVIELGRWTSYQGVQRRSADTRVRKIEDGIEEVLVSFAAIAAGEKVERAQAQERARLAEIPRLERAEQARLTKLEADRVELLEQKLMQVEERDRLAAFVASHEGQTDHPDHERYREFKSWVQRRLAGMNAVFCPKQSRASWSLSKLSPRRKPGPARVGRIRNPDNVLMAP